MAEAPAPDGGALPVPWRPGVFHQPSPERRRAPIFEEPRRFFGHRVPPSRYTEPVPGRESLVPLSPARALTPMAALLSAPTRDAFSGVLGFAPFVTDQEVAQRRFVDGITREFREIVPVAPEDFSFSVSPERSAGSLGDFRCVFRLLGKRQVITLGPDSLAVNLDDLPPPGISLGMRLLDRLRIMLASDFEDHEVYRAAVSHQIHVETVGPKTASEFLSSFAAPKARDAMESSPIPGVSYRPGLRAVFGGESWDLRRTVEISELLDGALFISTDMTLLDKTVFSFLSEPDFVENLFEWVDRATDLEYRTAS